MGRVISRNRGARTLPRRSATLGRAGGDAFSSAIVESGSVRTRVAPELATKMNRLRTGYGFLLLACASASWTGACSSNDSATGTPTTNANNADAGVVGTDGPPSDGGTPVTPTNDPPVVDPDSGAGVVPGPTGEPCGADAGTKCPLAEKCVSNDDCASALCGSTGPSTGTCIEAVSCIGTAGADFKCGPAANESCCHTIPVPGGSFTNYNTSGRASATTVSPFALDEFEVTVGRLRAFYNAKQGNLRAGAPAPGAGAHPRVPGSGWRSSWNESLPSSWVEINDRMINACAEGGDNANWGATTWTADPGANESKPANCVDWYTLSAFCAWDGGRLPTNAEWSYVAMGGSDQLKYPYGNEPPTFETVKSLVVTSFVAYEDATFGLYTEGTTYRAQNDGPLHISNVGTKLGKSKWGHMDMGGNVIEFLMEMATDVPVTCNDCANVSYPDPPAGPRAQPPTWKAKDVDGGEIPGDDFTIAKSVHDGKRLARGGSWMGEYEGHWHDNIKSQHWYPVWRTYSALGARCARDVK